MTRRTFLASAAAALAVTQVSKSAAPDPTHEYFRSYIEENGSIMFSGKNLTPKELKRRFAKVSPLTPKACLIWEDDAIVFTRVPDVFKGHLTLVTL